MTSAEAPASLSTGDLARMRGWSRQYAHTWSTRMEKKYGPPYIIRVGKRRDIRITLDGLKKIEADTRDPARIVERQAHEIKLLRRKVADLEQNMRGQGSRLIAQGRAISALETRVATWGKSERKRMVTS
jgi:hypothetical protein